MAVAAAAAPPQALVCHFNSFNLRPSIIESQFFKNKRPPPARFSNCYQFKSWHQLITEPPLPAPDKKRNSSNLNTQFICHLSRRKPTVSNAAVSSNEGNNYNNNNNNVLNKLLQIVLWGSEGAYILWLFLLPYAPGDPLWAISKDTINSLIGLSLNFFFILPLINAAIYAIPCIKATFDLPGNLEKVYFSNQPTLWNNTNLDKLFGRVVGVHIVDAPKLHPVSEGLFNFVIGWTVMFAPLLFTDSRRDRYQGSLDVLWGLQMFLTNTFLIPYMAIRLNEADSESTPRKRSELGTLMTNGAPIVGLIGGFACLLSILWALYGRMDGNFGSITERWEFLISYLGSERLAYAFIWDICFYTVFQPWLIGDNLQNIQKSKIDAVNYLRFVPVVGLVAYLFCLNLDEEQ